MILSLAASAPATVDADSSGEGCATVTFDANGGLLDAEDRSRQVPPGAAIGELPTPTREGYDNDSLLVSWRYEFAGWSTSADRCTGDIGPETVVTSDVTWHAHWRTICGGHGMPFSASVLDMRVKFLCPIIIDAGPCEDWMPLRDAWEWGSPDRYVLPQCTFQRDGHVFAGWKMYDTCSDADDFAYLFGPPEYGTMVYFGCQGRYAAGKKVSICGATVLVAQWRKGDAAHLVVRPGNANYGTATGGGAYKVGAKATATAKANDGYVFAGWYRDQAFRTPLDPKGYDNREARVKYTVPASDMTVYAKFVTKAAARKSLKFSSATKKLAKTAKKATRGRSFSLKLGIKSASLPTVTATGLPKGLSIDRITGRITGKASRAGSYTATVKVRDAAGNRISQKVKIKVQAPSKA